MATKAEVNSNDLVIIPPVNNINDYTFVKILGNGAQGVVNLYRQKSNNALYAIKEAKMAGIGKKFQEGIMKEADLSSNVLVVGLTIIRIHSIRKKNI
jgi:serine/threonine protein kinase